MTTRGKIVLTLIILGVAVFGGWRWWDKIAPTAQSQNPSINPAAVKKALEAAKAQPAPSAADVASK